MVVVGDTIQNNMSILFIEDNIEDKARVFPMLKNVFSDKILIVSTIQEGIEILDDPTTEVKLIICDYHGSSLALVKCLLSIRPNTGYLVISDMVNTIQYCLQ